MVKWQGRQRANDVEDRRGQSGGFGGGGLGGGFGRGSNPFGQGGGGFRVPMGRTGGGFGTIAIIVIIAIIYVVMGGNLGDLVGGGSSVSGDSQTTASTNGCNPPPDELTDFVCVIKNDANVFWTDYFAKTGQTYTPPPLVIFTGSTPSGCGQADSGSGPFYCPNDGKIYIDLAFYDQLQNQFGAGGDFAQLYVIAHEQGHHVQDVLGILGEFNQQRQTMSQAAANAYSVRVELQADCFAGMMGRGEQDKGYLEAGDYEEAINAANSIGDDRLTGGRIAPSEMTHGTSAQRMRWFKQGFNATDIAQCDTFNGAV